MGRRTIIRLAAALLVPVAFNACSCGDEPNPPPPVQAPSITSFTATPMSAKASDPVTLAWQTERADTVSITASPGGVIVDKVAEGSGTRTTMITANTTFTLTAVNAGGMATRMVNVTLMADGEVSIVTFAANPMTVAPGSPVTLTWDVLRATSIRIDQMGGGVVQPSTTMASGSVMVSPTVNTTYVLTAEGNGGPKMATASVVVEGTPVIDSFTASPQAIDVGQSSTLEWRVRDAAGVVVRTAGGTEVFNGANLMGSTVVMPAANETYTLTARSALGQEVTANVMVTVNQGARIISFTVNPTTVDLGDSAALSWTVERATRVDILARGSTVATSTQLMGTQVVTATTTTEYTLVAKNVAGDATAMVTLNVNPLAPRIRDFSVNPSPALIGTQATLSWEVLGANRIVVSGPAGQVVDTTAGVSTATVTVTSTLTRYTLVATNDVGSNTQFVDLIGQNLPAITVFTADPPIFAETSTTVNVAWNTTGTSVSLLVNGVPEVGFPTTATGAFALTLGTTPPAPIDLRLVATNAVGTASTALRLLQLYAELKPNETPAGALPLPAQDSGAGGAITAGDVDFYAVTVPANGNIWVEVSDGRGGCALDSFVTLFGPDGTTTLGADDDDGPGTCSQIDPLRDAFAANLPAGTYYVQVRGFNATTVGRYYVLVRASGPACANRILERGAGEQCDDGNTIPADGCNATCQIEPAGVLQGPGTNGVFPSTLAVVGQVQYFRVDMLGDGYIFADTFIPVPRRCDNGAGAASTDLHIQLLDSSFAVLGDDDNDGVGSCSRIDPQYDAFARVTAGTYWIAVFEDGLNSTVGAFTIEIRAIPIGCPNGIIEGTETCDDGNTVNGDGCSSLCAFEGGLEVEPNGTFGTATPIVGNSATIRGEIAPTADVDFYAVTVPAGAHLDAYISINSLDHCPVDPVGRLQLLGTNGTTVLATNSNGGPDFTCGRIWPYTDADSRGMAAGTYFIRVNELGDDAQIVPYFLHVNVILPGCGNSIIEGTEQCDDGNAADGDTCSSTCTLIPSPTVSLPAAAPVIVGGAIEPSHIRRAVRVDVTAPLYLLAETFAPSVAAGVCPSPAATRLQLRSADGATVLGEDTTDGVDSCSRFIPGTDAFVRLDVGTYLVSVEENGNDRTIFGYEVRLDSRPTDVCGNGVREPTLNELCDDGNTVAGDGCDATCNVEPVAVVANLGPFSFASAIVPIGDQDFIRLDLAQPSIIIARTHIPTVGSCTGGDTILRLFNGALTTELASNDDIDGANNRCSQIDGVVTAAARVAAGTYFLRVEDFLNDGTIPAYVLTGEIRAQNVCGNGLQEAANSELCDDGNTTAGDGCSATCSLEPTFVYDAVVGTPNTITSSHDANGEVEVVQINVPATMYMAIETFAPAAPNCATADTLIRLYASNGTLLAEDDQDGVNSCSLIRRQTDAGARLTAGTYYLTIEEFGRNAIIGAYQIQFTPTVADVCGDGIAEAVALEQCDDGNTTAGDGCSATCTFEIAATYNLPGSGQVVFAGNLAANTAAQAVQLNVTLPTLIRAEISAPAFPDCLGGIDPFMRLLDSNFVQVASDDADGRNSCSYFNPEVDAFALLLPGTYYLTVEEDGRNAIVGAYQLRITPYQQAVCGNGLLEAPEVCDDGNTVAGDGCTAACVLEAPVAEIEPNNTVADATTNGFVLIDRGITTRSGNVTPAGDLDYFAIQVNTVPAVLRARTYSALGNPLSTCNDAIDTRIQLRNAADTSLEDNDDINGAANRCSFLNGRVPDTDPNARITTAGTYFIRVSHFSATAPQPAGPYFLQISLENP